MKKIVTTAGCGRRSAETVNAWIDRRVLFALAFLAVLAVAAYAAAPSWWAARGLLNGRAANDYAVANQGQLKNMAKAARAELVAQGYFQLTDANAINTLVDGWSANTDRAMDYAPVNLGQLKAVAKPFYDALYLAYPWAAASASANDHAVANIGQLKAVFAFSVGAFDTDGDGLPDAWETKMFGSLDQGPAQDPDGDGLTNLVEWQKGIDPDNALSDEDGDGMLSVWEVQHELQPLNAADAGAATGRMERPATPQQPNIADYQNPEMDAFTQQLLYEEAMAGYETAMAGLAGALAAYDMIDPDGDGLSNLREFLAGTSPRARSSDGDIYSDYEEVAYGSNPLAAASIPPVRVQFSQLSASVILVASFRAEHVAGGETVTLNGGAATLLFAPAPNSAVLTQGQVTVTTDAVYGLAQVYVFAPAGTDGSQAVTLAPAGAPAGGSYTLVALAWQGSVGGTLNPPGPPPPGGPSPHSPPPEEGLVFTAHRAKSLLYTAEEPVTHPTRQIGSGTTEERWTKAGTPPVPPPYGDDGFNGDGDLEGDNADPGDPRDQIGIAGAGRVPAEPGEEGATMERWETEGTWENIGPYGPPGAMSGTYVASNAYSPPDKTASSSGSGGFEHGKALSMLAQMSFSRGGDENGWMGNGPLGLKSYTVTSSLTNGTGNAPPITYADQETGELLESTATFATQSAGMAQVEVRLQTNKDVEEGKPLSATFVLMKTTVAGSETTSESVATLLLTINSGKKSDACEVTAGELPSDVTKQGGVVSMRSPSPVAEKTISYTLLPFEVVSRDKFLAGSFTVPAEWDHAAMEFIGPNGENLGKYGGLLGGGSTKIYDNVTDILGEADVAAGGQSSNQKVWFVREGANSRKISFYTCFNAVGQAQIKLYPDEAEAPVSITHDLVAAEDFAGVIGYVDAWVKGTSFNWTVPYDALSGPVLALASQAADDPSAAGLSSMAVASSLVSGAILTADTDVPLAPDTVDLALGQPLSSAPALGGQAALQILPLNAIQPQNPLLLVPGTVYWLAGGVLYPLAEAQVTTLGEQAGSLTLAAPPPASPPLSSPPPGEGQGGSSGGEMHHLTRACLIPYFNVVGQVEGVGAITFGVLDGVKNGIQDDWGFIQLIANGAVTAGGWAYISARVEIQGWKNNPIKRAAELKVLTDRLCEDFVLKPLRESKQELSTWEGFKRRAWQLYRITNPVSVGASARMMVVGKDSWPDMVDGMTSWADDFCGRMMQGAEKTHWEGVPWAKDDFLSEVGEIQRQACYTFGYVFGYLCEQVAVGAVSDGALKIAQVAVKGGAHLAANLARRTAAAVAARAQWLKHLLAESGMGDALLRTAYEKGLVKCLTEPVGPTIKEVVFEVLEKAFSREAFDRSIYSWKHLQDDILQRPNLGKLLKQQGGEVVFQRRLSQLATILGDEFDAMAAKNFAKVVDEIILVPKPGGTVDEFFESFFRAFEGNPSLMVSADVGATFSKNSLSAEGKATLKKFLSDPNAGKLWEIDVPAIVDNEPAIPHNYWIRGILAELSIYKRVYKDAGYLHAPTAAGFDFTGLKWVQVKSLKNPDGAIGAMRKAVDALIGHSPGLPTNLRLHILKKPGTSSGALEVNLREYARTHPNGPGRVEILVDDFELLP